MKYTAEQQLEQSVEAFKAKQPPQEAVELSQENLLKTISAESRQQELSKSSIWQKAGAWFKENLIASPLRLAGSMGAVASFAVTLFVFSAAPQVSFASMVSELKQISSMFYSANMTTAGQHLMDIKVYYRASGQLRMESYSLGDKTTPTFVNIMDVSQGKGVMQLPGHGESVPFDFEPANEPLNMQEDPLYWRKLILEVNPSEAEKLGTKSFAGTELTGYLIEDSGVETRVWINSDSQLPVKVWVTQHLEDGTVGFEMKADVTYNQRFDDSLFDLN